MAEQHGSTNSFAHGAPELPSVVVKGYGLEFKEKGRYAGERANRRAFFDALVRLAKLSSRGGGALGGKQIEALPKSELERMIAKGDATDAVVVLGAIEEYCEALASVLARYLKHESWRGAEPTAPA